MPERTYVPLRKPALGVLGNEQRSRRFALGLVTSIARMPGGTKLIRAFDYTHDHPASAVEVAGVTYPSPIGLQVDGESATGDALASMGYGFTAARTRCPLAQPCPT